MLKFSIIDYKKRLKELMESVENEWISQANAQQGQKQKETS